jgi:hypothetical protein
MMLNAVLSTMTITPNPAHDQLHNRIREVLLLARVPLEVSLR